MALTLVAPQPEGRNQPLVRLRRALDRRTAEQRVADERIDAAEDLGLEQRLVLDIAALTDQLYELRRGSTSKRASAARLQWRCPACEHIARLRPVSERPRCLHEVP